MLPLNLFYDNSGCFARTSSWRTRQFHLEHESCGQDSLFRVPADPMVYEPGGAWQSGIPVLPPYSEFLLRPEQDNQRRSDFKRLEPQSVGGKPPPRSGTPSYRTVVYTFVMGIQLAFSDSKGSCVKHVFQEPAMLY